MQPYRWQRFQWLASLLRDACQTPPVRGWPLAAAVYRSALRRAMSHVQQLLAVAFEAAALRLAPSCAVVISSPNGSTSRIQPHQPYQLWPAKQSVAMPADWLAVICTQWGSTCTGTISIPAKAEQHASSLFSFSPCRRRDLQDEGPLPHVGADLGLEMVECQCAATCSPGRLHPYFSLHCRSGLSRQFWPALWLVAPVPACSDVHVYRDASTPCSVDHHPCLQHCFQSHTQCDLQCCKSL